MKNSVILLFFFIIFIPNVLAKSLDQKKNEIKKIYEAGGMSKIEYQKALEFLEKPETEKKEKKKSFSLDRQKKLKKQSLLNLLKTKSQDKEKITLKKIDELGEPAKFNNSYYPQNMLKRFKGCNNSFKCVGDKSGKVLYNIFSKRTKAYQQRNPGEMIKGMAMFEVFYSSKLWYAREALERYKKDVYKDKLYFLLKENDEKEIRSLFGINKGRISMREALGMTAETSSEEAIKKFWLLGEFLALGTGVKNEKLSPDLKKRQELLQAYKFTISNLKKKLQKDVEEEDDEKSVE